MDCNQCSMAPSPLIGLVGSRFLKLNFFNAIQDCIYCRTNLNIIYQVWKQSRTGVLLEDLIQRSQRFLSAAGVQSGNVETGLQFNVTRPDLFAFEESRRSSVGRIYHNGHAGGHGVTTSRCTSE